MIVFAVVISFTSVVMSSYKLDKEISRKFILNEEKSFRLSSDVLFNSVIDIISLIFCKPFLPSPSCGQWKK